MFLDEGENRILRPPFDTTYIGQADHYFFLVLRASRGFVQEPSPARTRYQASYDLQDFTARGPTGPGLH